MEMGGELPLSQFHKAIAVCCVFFPRLLRSRASFRPPQIEWDIPGWGGLPGGPPLSQADGAVGADHGAVLLDQDAVGVPQAEVPRQGGAVRQLPLVLGILEARQQGVGFASTEKGNYLGKN